MNTCICGKNMLYGRICMECLHKEGLYTSNAEWPEGSTTMDEHKTRAAAEAVCRRLEKEGLGGCRIVFPVRTWVEDKT